MNSEVNDWVLDFELRVNPAHVIAFTTRDNILRSDSTLLTLSVISLQSSFVYGVRAVASRLTALMNKKQKRYNLFTDDRCKHADFRRVMTMIDDFDALTCGSEELVDMW